MHRLIHVLAKVTAIVGGFVLLAIVCLTTLSIIGRSLSKAMHSDFATQTFGSVANWLIDAGLGEINGNYELLEAGVAFAIFAFLPICQLFGAHATVDVFTSALPLRAVKVLQAVWEVVLTATLIFVTWRLSEGMWRYVGNGETTFFLQMPVWWSYAASLTAACIACVVGVYCAVFRVHEALTGRKTLPDT